MEYISPEPSVYAVCTAPAPAVYAAKAPVVEHIAPAPVACYATAPTMLAAPAPVVEHVSPDPTVYVAPAHVVEYISPDPTVYVAPAPVVEYLSPDPAECAVAEYITPSPMEFVEAADDEFCRDDFEELCNVARMSRQRLWRRVWHGCSSPPGASKSERTWRRLSKRLCYEESFDEMKRTCADCGMFEDEDDILVCCQGLDCSLRSADYDIPGVFHGRCAASWGHSGGARWQTCPWRPNPATVIGVDDSDEEKYIISMTRLEEKNYAALMIQRGCRWSRKRIVLRAAWEKKLQEKLREARRRFVAGLPVGANAKRKAETFREMQSTLKADDKELRKILNKELASLELDLCVLSRSGERRGCEPYRILPITTQAVCSLTMALSFLRRVTSSSQLVQTRYQVNLITPRCTCEGNVSRHWYVTWIPTTRDTLPVHASRLFRC